MSIFLSILLATCVIFLTYGFVWMITIYVGQSYAENLVDKVKHALKILGKIYFIPLVATLVASCYSPLLFRIGLLFIILLTYPSYRVILNIIYGKNNLIRNFRFRD